MPEKNENCLEGLACPQCGSLEPFGIHATCRVVMYDNGSDHATEYDWDDTDHIECETCGHGGTVKSFRTAQLDAQDSAAHLADYSWGPTR